LLLLCVISARAAAADLPTPDALILSAPLTHSDWVLKDNVPGLDDGLAGVRHIVDMSNEAGLSRIFWRRLGSCHQCLPPTLAGPCHIPSGCLRTMCRGSTTDLPVCGTCSTCARRPAGPGSTGDASIPAARSIPAD